MELPVAARRPVCEDGLDIILVVADPEQQHDEQRSGDDEEHDRQLQDAPPHSGAAQPFPSTRLGVSPTSAATPISRTIRTEVDIPGISKRVPVLALRLLNDSTCSSAKRGPMEGIHPAVGGHVAAATKDLDVLRFVVRRVPV